MSSRRSCGKVRYPRRHRAEMALHGIRLRFESGPVRTYACPRCNGWHLTSQEG